MVKNCKTEGCTRPHRARGLCLVCYEKARAAGEFVPRGGPLPACEVPDCERLATAGGWCHRHRQRFNVYGDPLEPRRLAPEWSPDELAKCDRFLDSVPPGRRARAGEVQDLALSLGRPLPATATRLVILRRKRRASA